MSCFSGPEVVNGGLTLCLDASNRKSFSGVGTERLGGISASFNNWNGLVGTSTAYINQGKSGVYLNITAANGGGVNWWNSVNGGQACSSNTQYVVTAKVRYVGNTPHPNLFYVRQYNSVGGQTSESGRYNSANQVDIGNGYYLAWAYFITDATATSFLVHGYDYQNIQIWLEDVECKIAGLGDISGNGYNGTFVNSPIYSSTNSGILTFNGSNQYTSIGNLGAFPAAGTVDFWMNSTEVINYRNPFHTNYTGTGNNVGIRFEQYTGGGFNVVVGNDAGTYAGGTITSSLQANTWYNVVVTWNTATSTLTGYLNADQRFTQSHTYWATTLASVAFGVGFEISRAFKGSLSMLKIYNKTLTATEVRQNFNAVRSRFGI